MNNTLQTVIQTQRTHELRQLVQMGLCHEDAEDVYQDAAIVLLQAMSEQRLTIRVGAEAYLHGVCHKLALKRLEELRRRYEAVDDERLDRLLELTEEAEEAPDAMLDDEEAVDYMQLLQRVLQTLPERDFALLRGFYLEGKSMEQLATEHEMASVEVARTTKCRIIGRLRERARQMINELF